MPPSAFQTDPNAAYASRMFDPEEPQPGQYGSDWLSRINIPDMYPRKYDPYLPSALIIPGAPELTTVVEPPEPGEDIFNNITTPAQRPFVVQRGVNFTVNILAANTPVPLVNQQFFTDSIVLGVVSTAANSVFLGYGSSITVNSGIELFPGVPVTLIPPNSREQWELQRAIETLAAIMCRINGIPFLGPYRSPRVVFDASDLFVVAAAATNVAALLFYVPELQ